MLSALEYNVFEVESAELAFGALQAFFADVVFFSLPWNDEHCARFACKAKLLQSHLKVIVTSGYRPPTCLPQGVDAFVQMPFSLQKIDEIVKQLFVLP